MSQQPKINLCDRTAPRLIPRRDWQHRLRSITAQLCAGLLIILFTPAHGQVNNEKYRDYFLVGEFGEVCTMCEIIVLCEKTATVPTYDSIPADGEFTLYHLQTRTFWSQITTIWDWFIANFSAASLAQGHERPVWIYTSSTDAWSGPEIANARIALEPPLLTFGDKRIDRINQAWLAADDASPLGYCQRLPLWESLEIIEQKNDRGGPP